MLTRDLSLVLLTNIVLGAPMPMLIILGSLAGAGLAPTDMLITLPVSVQLLAGILFAGPLSGYMGRHGRRSGFLLVSICTVFGGLLAVTALSYGGFWLLCLAHLIMGAALVGVGFLRFAAAEAVPEMHRANAISFTLSSGIVAALLGPALFEHSRQLFHDLPYAGAYASIAVLGGVGALPILLMSLPAPSGPPVSARSLRPRLWPRLWPRVWPRVWTQVWPLLSTRPDVRLAIGMAALSQGIMVLMMVPTPQAMVATGFEHAQAASVIRWHVVAMFAPGLITGLLIQRLGVYRVMLAGLVLLLLAALVAMAGILSVHFHMALILLGIGWNFGFIGATQLLQRAVPAIHRAVVQGLNDTVVAAASVSASVLSGLLYTGIGWFASALMIVPVMLLALFCLLPGLRRRGLSAS